MWKANAALAVGVILSLAYGVLALFASSHIQKEKTSPMTPALSGHTVLWAFYDIYDEEGSKLAKYGQVLFVAIVAAYVYWGVASRH
jgi:Na+-translocating ferredoxin:NAD+ oxidoreductase RnfD subunit